MMKALKLLSMVVCCAISAWSATETLFSNWTFAVAPGDGAGSLWVFSRGENSGATLLKVKETAAGVQVTESSQEMLSTEKNGVHDRIFVEDLASRRRVPTVKAGKLGWVIPMYGEDNGSFVNPEGFFSIRRLDGRSIFETPLTELSAAADLDTALMAAVSGFAYDSSMSTLWIARGKLGLTGYDVSRGTNDPKEIRLVLNRSSKSLDTLKESKSLDFKKYADIYDVTQHPSTGELWLATASGLWIRGTDGAIRSASKSLDTMSVSGVWIGGSPLQVIAETSKPGKDAVKGSLYRMKGAAKDFSKVAFLDTGKVVQKKDIFDNADYTVNDVAFVGDLAFVSVRGAVGSTVSGYLKLDSLGARAYEGDEGSAWLYGFDMGVTDRDVDITSITAFPMADGVTGLAIAAYGNGISVSADTGRTWTPILNRTKLSDNLGSIRMVPSIIQGGDQSLVSYKVGKNSKITIEVFSYDMKKVRTIVKSAERFADKSRSTNAKEDFWDGKDDHGRYCTMGVYYVRVKDNHDHVGWGKVMTLGGRK